MKFFDRFLLVVYTLGVMALLLIFGLVSAGWTTPVNLLQIYVLDYSNRLVIGIFILTFALISLKFFLQALSTGHVPAQALIQETDMGQVRVSIEALENLVYRVVMQIRGVRVVKPRVVCRPEGVCVFVRAEVTPDTVIPDTTLEIQNKLQGFIKEYVGVPVHSVKILVDNITENKSGTSRKLN